jgi:hypothetical protein
MKDNQQFTRYSANVLLEAAAIQEKKGQDYQNPLSRVRQVDHYPRGVHSILDTVNGKVLRMVSVLETMEAGGKVNFESVEDSALDAINYLSFIVAYLRGEVDGQDGTKDIFNRRMSKATHPTTALIPEKFKTKLSDSYTTMTVGMTSGTVLNTVGYGNGKAVWPMKEGARGTTE